MQWQSNSERLQHIMDEVRNLGKLASSIEMDPMAACAIAAGFDDLWFFLHTARVEAQEQEEKETDE